MSKTQRITRRSMRFRGPLALDTSKLDLANFHHHWVADRDNDIPEALSFGYEFVMNNDVAENGDKLASKVQKTKAGETLYLMRCPMELWEQAQKDQASEYDATDSELHPRHQQGRLDGKGIYTKQILK